MFLNSDRRRMENSTYVPTALQSPALMVLSSPSESSTDSNLHLGSNGGPGATNSNTSSHSHPPTSLSFTTTSGLHDAKDIHVPFTTSSFTALPHVPPSLYGHVPEGFPNLSAHLLHMHAPFLVPSMDRALGLINPTGGGAFRPVSSAAAAVNGFHSAFISAAKYPKLEHNGGLIHHGQQLRGLSHGLTAAAAAAMHSHNMRTSNGNNHNIMRDHSMMSACGPTTTNVKLTGGNLICATTMSSSSVNFGDGSSVSNGGGSGQRLSPMQIKDEGSSDATSSDFGDRLTGTPCSDVTDGTERSTPDENRDKRKKTSLFAGQSTCCPVCGITLRNGEFEVHFYQEIEKLSKISRMVRRAPRDNKDSSAHNRSISSSSSSCSNSSNNNNNNSSKKCKDSPNQATDKTTTPESRWDSFMRIKTNRQGRLGARSKIKKRRHADEAVCPVCCERVIGTPEELNAHAEQCLRKRDIHGDEDEPVDVEGESFEEYEWAGQTRIRATTLLEGGYAASGFQTTTIRRDTKDDDDDVDLNVDGDDTATYGQAQYSEADLILTSCDEPGEEKDRAALRGALITGSSSSQSIKVESDTWSDRYSGSPHESENDNRISSSGEAYHPDVSRSLDSTTSTDHVIEALKSRLKEMECAQLHNHQQQLPQEFGINRNKCRICMETYEVPVVSVSCWHVYCEVCWLRALGVKKLCPQCNMITSPADLRKLYM